ncbi:MAG: flagellar protein FlgN [Alloalcanivorax venustensis]|uniref:flagella synthesis protein FlgN n=1 Tax=Alloalcanivorax venustensis TaxID=172371 RepID=UPI0032978B7D
MSLAEHLERHRARLDALIGLLDEERQLLRNGGVDGDGLTRVAQAKQEQFQALERFETQRRQVQRRLGYDDDRAGDARAAADAGCAGLWESIRERADQVARLNRTNGLLIGIRLEHNQRMLNFIEEAAGKGLYGPDGQARAAGGHVSSRV